MSAVDTAAVLDAAPRSRVSTRFLRSELWLIFGRRRNWAGLAVLASVPFILAVSVKSSAPTDPNDGPVFLTNVVSNGLFVALTALAIELPFFLLIAVGAIAGDSIAGEANTGTLRYLLAVPVNRTRLIAVKFAGLAVFTMAATLVIAGVGALLGLILFGGGPLVTLSGTEIPFWSGVGRVLLVCVYMTVCLLALAAI